MYITQPLDQEERDALDDASGLLGRELIRARSSYGAVRIRFVPWEEMPTFADADPDVEYLGPGGEFVSGDEARHTGYALHRSGCFASIKVAYDGPNPGQSIAHEIGHVFRLDHVGDPTDVMAGTPMLDVEQDHFEDEDRLDRRINAFTRLCLR